MDDQRFPSISSVGMVSLTGRGREYVKDGPTAEYQRVLVVIYRCSFHREPDGSDRRFCCQSHVPVNQERAFSAHAYTGANCELIPSVLSVVISVFAFDFFVLGSRDHLFLVSLAHPRLRHLLSPHW